MEEGKMTITQEHAQRWSPQFQTDFDVEDQTTTSVSNESNRLKNTENAFASRLARLMRLTRTRELIDEIGPLCAFQSTAVLSGFRFVDLEKKFLTAFSNLDLRAEQEDIEDSMAMCIVPRHPRVIFEEVISFRDGHLPRPRPVVSIDPRFFESDDD